MNKSGFSPSNAHLYKRKPQEETIVGQASRRLTLDALSRKGMTGYLIAKVLEKKNPPRN
ncbi:MAG: hypothetical protein PHH70_05780 [Candidatus Gracilibacteria bacterium]|nr:hypothetical protein [Candidatus Gracilibacteria bacterium]